jgi:diketogulonate reductase-like aldo/keto reductase
MARNPGDRPPAMSRRNALRLLAGATAGMFWRRGGATPRPRSILKRPIPASGELLPAIGLGTSRTFDVGASPAGRQPLREVLRRFIADGGTLVDTSPMYGQAEVVVGDLSAELGARRQLFLATKVWTSGREAGIRQMQQSMRRLRSERLDLIQVHNLVDTDTQLATLRAWKDSGRVRYLGVTHYHRSAYEELERVLRRQPLDFVQLNYSLAEREAARRLLPLAAERGVAVIVNRPFARGSLFQRVRGRTLPGWCADFDCHSWAQLFLKYVLSHPAVTCAIPATDKPRHLVDNMQAGYGRLPDPAQRRRMEQLVD